MTEEETFNLAAVRAAYEEHRYFETADENSTIYEAPSLPYGGSFRGLNAMNRMVTHMRATWGRPGGDGKSLPTLHREIEYAVGGDMVIAHMMFSGTGPAGHFFAFPICEMWRFRDRTLTEIRVLYFDAAKAIDCFNAPRKLS